MMALGDVKPHPKPAKRRKRWRGVSTAVRVAVRTRARGRCEAKAAPDCAGRGLQFHHVLPRSRGGRNHISNGLWVCLYCHAFIHAHPRLARERGWIAGSAS